MNADEKTTNRISGNFVRGITKKSLPFALQRVSQAVRDSDCSAIYGPLMPGPLYRRRVVRAAVAVRRQKTSSSSWSASSPTWR